MLSNFPHTLYHIGDRERQVLSLRYGIADNQERTLEQVGNIMNITRERVRQIEEKALRRMRHPTRIERFSDFR